MGTVLPSELNRAQAELDAELIRQDEEARRIHFKFQNELSREQVALFITFNILDVYSTYRGLKYDCVEESNPLLGKNPSPGSIITKKVILTPIVLNTFTEFDLKAANVLYTGVLYNNYRVLDRAKQQCNKR